MDPISQTETVPCRFCGASDTAELFTARDHATAERFSVARCRNCGFVYTNPRPFLTDLGRYYPPQYYGDRGFRFGFGLEHIVQFFRRRLADSIASRVSGAGSILEIGSGRGSLLRELGRRGWRAVGTEYSPDLATPAQSADNVQIYAVPDLQDCGFPAGSFDVVVCYHVLEHLPDPLVTLREVRRIIRPGGQLIIAVPNFGGWVASLSGPSWFALDVPRHLSHFTPSTLEAMLIRAGFSCQRRSTYSMEQDVFGFAQSILNMAGFPFNGFYDLIRSSSAQLGSGRKGPLGSFALAVLGGALAAVGLPLTWLLSLFSQGGTLNVSAVPVAESAQNSA